MIQRDFQSEKKVLNEIMKRCKLYNEDSLLYYCTCIMKMHRAYYKLQTSHMISYVRQIMSPAFQLLIKYFADRAAEYFDTDSESIRMRIFDDIECSVPCFYDAFEAVIRSTNGADRMLFQSAPVDIGIQNAAPKLCAYYSDFLNCLAKTFKSTSIDEYAFCVYPTISTRPKATLLFTTMHRKGKIGVISIPGKDIADVQYIRTVLSHEFYHVMPGELRFRRERAGNFLRIMVYDFSYRILEEINIPETCNIETLEKLLLNDAVESIKKEMKWKSDGDRIFYSEKIKGIICNSFLQSSQKFQCIDINELYTVCYNNTDSADYEQYVDRIQKLNRLKTRIVDNAYLIVSRKELEYQADFYMDIFREVFADLLMIITLRLPPDDYLNAFHYVSFQGASERSSVTIYLRIHLVLECMTETVFPQMERQSVFLNTWKKWREVLYQRKDSGEFIKEIVLFEERLESSYVRSMEAGERTDSRGDVITPVLPNVAIIDQYLKYFAKCRDVFLQFEAEKQVIFDNFRNKFMIAHDYSDYKIWNNIGERYWEGVRFVIE